MKQGSIRKIFSFLMVIAFIFTSITLPADKVGAASTTKWIFSDSAFTDLGTISSNVTVNRLTLNANSSKTMKVASCSLSLDGTTFTKYLSLGGSGSTSYRSVKVPVNGACTIKVTLKSSGSSTRALVVADQNGNQLSTMSASSDISNGTYQYTGSGSSLYLYSSNSGINLYQIEVTQSQTSSTDIPSGAIVVASDGSGAYRTVQAAINSLGSSSSANKTIYIKNGTYYEVVTIPSGISNLNLIGESKDGVILHYDNYNAKSNGQGGTYGTGGSASAFIKGSNISVQNITFKNSFVEQGNSGEQAVALSVTGSKVKFHNCNILGNQDTLLCDGGTQYFYKCLIAGDVDFIFGRSQAVFDNCEIRSLNRGSSSNNGYVTAARTAIEETYGFVFLNCNLTCESGTASNSVWLGRPWCPSGTSVNKPAVAYINCTMGAHIKTDGWTSMSGVSPSHGRFYEYNSSGSGAAVNSNRPQLSASEAANYTIYNVLKGWTPSF